MVSTDKIYYLQYSDSFSGDIFVRVNNRLFVLLEHAFHQMFSNSLLNYNYLFQSNLKFLTLIQKMSMECLVHLEVVF